MVCYSPRGNRIFFFNLNASRKILINGVEAKGRGINYSSNALGAASNDPWYEEVDQIIPDIQDISAGGFNWIKIYGTESNASLHYAALDKVKAANGAMNVFVLDFVTYDTDYSVATGGANRTAKINDFVALVNIFKTRPEVKIIGFANENNLPNNRGSSTNGEGDVVTSIADWYSLVDAAIAAGKAAAPGTTIKFATVDAELGTYPGDASLPNLDILGINIYRGTTFTDLKQDLIRLTSKPTIITEFGIERTDNSEGEQKDQANEELSLIQEAEDLYPFVAFWILFKWTHNSNSSQFYHIAAPVASGFNASRPKYTAYTTIKNFLISHTFGN